MLSRKTDAKANASGLFRLSRNGCGRATAYAKSNKIVTIGRKTHAAWLDSQDGKFLVRARTLDRDTGEWSPVYTLGEAHDNHGGPALAADGSGHLHIVYFPHHHPFRYRRSLRPSDASAWTKEVRLGKRCTYPCLVCRPDGALLLACRESSRRRWALNLYHKPPDKDWHGPQTLFHGNAPSGYTHWGSSLALGSDGRTVHLGWHVYETGMKAVGYAVGYLRSPDGGETWERSDGTRVDLPATTDTIDIVEGAPRPKDPLNMRTGAIAVDRNGTPWLPYSCLDRRPQEAWVARPDPKGGWKKIPLLPWIQKRWPKRGAIFADNIAFDREGTMYVAVTTIVPDAKKTWGHPSKEVALLVSKNEGRTFEVFELSPPDPTTPAWFPSLERPTGKDPIGVPSLIYTHGHAGKGCDDILSNNVFFCDTRTRLRPQR